MKKKFKARDNKKYKVLKLSENDFDAVKAFYDNEIEKLENKKFFMKYKDDELLFILKYGIMCCCVDDKGICAVSGIDKDEDYGNKIKNIIALDVDEYRIFEYGGVFSRSDLRGKGLISNLYDIIIKEAKKDKFYKKKDLLCAVIQIDNTNSLINFFKKGFVMCGIKQIEDYTFCYLIRPLYDLADFFSIDETTESVDVLAEDLEKLNLLMLDYSFAVMTKVENGKQYFSYKKFKK